MNLNQKVNLKLKNNSHLVAKWEVVGNKNIFLNFDHVKDMINAKTELDDSGFFKSDIIVDRKKSNGICARLRVKGVK